MAHNVGRLKYLHNPFAGYRARAIVQLHHVQSESALITPGFAPCHNRAAVVISSLHTWMTRFVVGCTSLYRSVHQIKKMLAENRPLAIVNKSVTCAGRVDARL